MSNGSQERTGWRLALVLLPFWVLLPLAALLAVLPLIRNGCSCGHDFTFHALSWMEAATQFAHGNLHPQWAFTPAYNAGEPRFVFYPPLSWTIGGVLGLVVPWGATPIVSTWLALTAAGLGCWRLLREFVAPGTALLVAAVYAVNPYMLFTAYERTAYAELLAAAWLPLLLHGALRRRVRVAGIAVPVALLWLTNAPAAVVGCYGLALLTLARLMMTLRQPETAETTAGALAVRTVAGTALGIGLAAFYIVPAAWERRYVQIRMAMIDGMRITDNFLFHRTADADHDAVLRTASLVAVGVLIATGVALALAWLRAKETRQTVATLAVLSGVIAVLLTPASGIVWRHAPELPFLQFPWRFLALLMPVLALLVALALGNAFQAKRWSAAVALVLAAAFTLGGYGSFRQGCDPEDTIAARLALYHSANGSEPTDEYTPVTADNDALGRANPPYWLAGKASASPAIGATPGALRWPLEVSSATAQVLILNLRDYPAWRLRLNGRVVTAHLPRTDGLIAMAVPAGVSHLEAAYMRMPDQTAGWIVSAVSLAVLALLLLRRRG